MSKQLVDELTRPLPRGMRPREFGRKYKLSEASVYKGIHAGQIPAVRVGKRFVVLWQAWEAQAGIPAA